MCTMYTYVYIVYDVARLCCHSPDAFVSVGPTVATATSVRPLLFSRLYTYTDDNNIAQWFSIDSTTKNSVKRKCMHSVEYRVYNHIYLLRRYIRDTRQMDPNKHIPLEWCLTKHYCNIPIPIIHNI